MSVMCNQFPQKRGRHSSKLSGMLLLIASLLIYAAPATSDAEEATPAASDAKTALCKGLKPFNNIDELLYQFYINLDSDCLFEMPVEELEKVWDTKILFADRARPGEFPRLRDSADFLYKPYKSEKDAFYVEIGGTYKGRRNVFKIWITEEYYKKHVTLFPDGNYPKLLPPPFTETNPRSMYLREPEVLPHPKIKGVYRMELDTYCWSSPDNARKLCLGGRDISVLGAIMERRPAIDSINNSAE